MAEQLGMHHRFLATDAEATLWLMYHLCHGGCGARDTAHAASGALAALAQVAHIRRLARHTAETLMKTPGSVSPAVIEGRLSNRTRLLVMMAAESRPGCGAAVLLDLR